MQDYRSYALWACSSKADYCRLQTCLSALRVCEASPDGLVCGRIACMHGEGVQGEYMEDGSMAVVFGVVQTDGRERLACAEHVHV